jgi:hypothetical protein
MTAGDYANFVAAFSGSAAAIAAVITIRVTARERSDERLAGYAVRTLERAYQSLVGPDGVAQRVPADRLAWLTSARLIEQYKDAKRKIKNSVVLHECEGHEEHWRHQFYLALQPLQQVSPEYFSTNRPGSGPIHEISAVIIHAFATWPEGKVDPVDIYRDKTEAISKLRVHLMWFSLRRYLGLN